MRTLLVVILWLAVCLISFMGIIVLAGTRSVSDEVLIILLFCWPLVWPACIPLLKRYVRAGEPPLAIRLKERPHLRLLQGGVAPDSDHAVTARLDQLARQ